MSAMRHVQVLKGLLEAVFGEVSLIELPDGDLYMFGFYDASRLSQNLTLHRNEIVNIFDDDGLILSERLKAALKACGLDIEIKCTLTLTNSDGETVDWMVIPQYLFPIVERG